MNQLAQYINYSRKKPAFHFNESMDSGSIEARRQVISQFEQQINLLVKLEEEEELYGVLISQGRN